MSKEAKDEKVVRIQCKPVLYIRECKSGNYELRMHEEGHPPNKQPRRAVVAVIAVEGDAAVLLAWRRKANLGAVLTMAQVASAKVVRLVTRNGTRLLGAAA